jgi:16S rRNA G966 N2-methylase RsmD
MNDNILIGIYRGNIDTKTADCGSNGDINGVNEDIGEGGVNGAIGEDGSNGAIGEGGSNGAIGEGGVNGAIGEGGSNGAIGEDGVNGAIGEDGSNGAIGEDGNNGAIGEGGSNGAIGEGGSIDPWESAINDNKFIIKNKIMRIFPILKNTVNYNNLLIDDESFSFITIREIAHLTSKIICNHLSKHNINPQKVSIADYCAGVGGNVISFSKFFNHVYAIEINKTRSEYLLNNIGIYNCKNVSVINKSSIDYNQICTDNNHCIYNDNPVVIFIDPPWGGIDYKNTEILKIKLDNMLIEELVMDIFDKFTLLIDKYNDYENRFIVLKLPKNFDIESFYNYITNYKKYNYFTNLYLYILNKMIIIVCEYVKL